MWPSSTVSRVPRTLTSPSMAWETPGIRVAVRRGRISRTIPAGAAQISAPMRKMTAWSVGELAISIEEKKIAKGVRASNQVFGTYGNECSPEIGRPFGMEFKWRAGRGMAECQSGRVQCLTGGRPLQRLGGLPSRAGDAAAAAPGVDRIAHDRVADMLQVDPDLVGPAGVKLEPEQVGDAEPARDERVGSSRPSRRVHGHPFAIAGMARQRGLDHGRAGIEMAPRERRIGPLDPPRRDGRAQP